MKKKWILLTSAGAATVLTYALAIAPSVKGGTGFHADGCQHTTGNHYSAKAATCASAGNKEFWVCCDCHEKFIEEPATGHWTEGGIYAGTLEEEHPAYIAPLGTHNRGAWQIVEGEGTLGVNTQCPDCGEWVYETPQNSIKKPGTSTAEWAEPVLQTTGVPWTHDEATGVYHAGKGKNPSGGEYATAMTVTITKAGTLAFDVEIWCEVGYDYMSVFKNSTVTDWTRSDAQNTSASVYTTKDKKPKTGYQETVQLDVEEGDVLSFVKTADYSGWGTKDGANYDGVDVKFLGGYETGLVSFDLMGADVDLIPVIKINNVIQTLPEDPVRDGYIFDGWYTSNTFAPEEKVVVGTNVGEATKLYAKWFDIKECHPLMGDYKAISIDADSSSTGYSEFSCTVDHHGMVSLKTGSTAVTGSFGAVVDGATVFGEAGNAVTIDGDIVTIQPVETSSYAFILVKGNSALGLKQQSWSDGLMLQYKDANETIRTAYVNKTTNVLHAEVTYVPLEPDTCTDFVKLTNGASRENTGFEVFEGSTKLATVGYDGNAFKEVTDAYYGVYSSSVENSETTKIIVSGNGIFKTVKNGTKSSNLNYTADKENHTLKYASGSDASEYILNLKDKTFEEHIPTIVVTYDLGGKAATLVESGGSKYPLDGNTQTFVGGGAWVYYDDYVTIQDGMSDDGEWFFIGWYTDAELKNAVGTSKPLESFTLYAKWAKACTMTIVKNNGEEDETKKLKEGDVPTLAMPKNDNYLFGGWYTDSTFETPYVSGGITEDTTVYAKWEEKPAYAKGAGYVGCNVLYSSGHQNYSFSSGRAASFTSEGQFKMGSTVLAEYGADDQIVDGVLTLEGTKKIAFDVAEDGRYFMACKYSTPGSDPIPGDIDFRVQLKDADETASFVETTIVGKEATLIETTIKKGDEVIATYVSYVDATLDRVYANVSIETDQGNTFGSVHNGTSYAKNIVIKSGGEVVATWGGDGKSLTRNDGKAGTYTGTFKGVETAIVLDGFGNVQVGEAKATYASKESTITFTLDGRSYSVVIDGAAHTYTMVLDGKEGTYEGANGTLVLTGWGDAKVGTKDVTYEVMDSTLVAVTLDGERLFYTLDLEAKTYTVASASKFAGMTFTGTYKDSFGDPNTATIVFDDSAAISGVVKYGVYGTMAFTGAIDGDVLTITYYGKDFAGMGSMSGHTVSFRIDETAHTLSVIEDTTTNSAYKLDDAVFTSPSWKDETPVGPEDPAGLIAGDYEGTDDSGDLWFSLTVAAGGASGSLYDGASLFYATDLVITKTAEGEYSYAGEDFNSYDPVTGTIVVNEDGTLTITVSFGYDYINVTAILSLAE